MKTGCAVCDTTGRTFRSSMPLTEEHGVGVHPACAPDLRAAVRMRSDVVTDGDVLSWSSNGAHPFGDMMSLWAVLGTATEAQVAATETARRSATLASVGRYMKSMPAPSGERLAEMRAAFGPGQTVVDVITGREVQL